MGLVMSLEAKCKRRGPDKKSRPAVDLIRKAGHHPAVYRRFYVPFGTPSSLCPDAAALGLMASSHGNEMVTNIMS